MDFLNSYPVWFASKLILINKILNSFEELSNIPIIWDEKVFMCRKNFIELK